MAEALHSIVTTDVTLRTCVQRIAETHAGVVLFVEHGGRFRGLLTAGDVFRLLAHGVGMDDPVEPHINRDPITVTTDWGRGEILRLMTTRKVTQLPVLKNDGTIDRIITQADLIRDNVLTNHAIIMAGGEGRRLRPLTEQIPKALVAVNGKPLLEHLLERLNGFGIMDVTICLRYRADEIRAAIGDGRRWHMNVDYVEEPAPLGTAGALSLLNPKPTESFFVLNCDVMSDVDLVQMHKVHALNRSKMTIAVTDHKFEVPYGVVEVNHERVVRVSEKPKLTFSVNAGIYLIDPTAVDRVPSGCAFDMPELIQSLLESDERVCSFPIRSRWVDVGDPDALSRAQQVNWEAP